MKKFIKRRWPLLFGVLGIALLLVFLYYKGFRITYAPELENSWDAISACAAWAGAIGTVAVLIYNHIAIELTQKSVRQAVDLQLFEKRVALYNAITDDRAFYNAPLSLKIVYNEEIYQLYSDIVELCEKRWAKIWEFAQAFRVYGWEKRGHGNVCHELYGLYTKQIETEIQNQNADMHKHYTNDGKAFHLESNLENATHLHKEICKKYAQLEEKMRTILEQSIDL